MRIIINQADMARALGRVGRVVMFRGAINPALAGVLIEASKGMIRLSATDLETAVRVAVPAETNGRGRALVSYRSLADLVALLSGELVLEAAADGPALGISSGSGRAELAAMKLDDFPEIEFPGEEERLLALPGETLRGMARHALLAVGGDTSPSRAVLTGARLRITGGTAVLVASDGVRVAMASADGLPEGIADLEVVLPRPVLDEAARQDEELVTVVANDRLVGMVSGGVGVCSRRFTDGYPTVEDYLDKEYPVQFAVGGGDLVAALERVMVVARTVETRPVGVSLDGGALVLTAEAPAVGSVTERIPLVGDPPAGALDAKFNTAYLLAGARGCAALEACPVCWSGTGETPGAGQLRLGLDGALYWALPMRAQRSATHG